MFPPPSPLPPRPQCPDRVNMFPLPWGRLAACGGLATRLERRWAGVPSGSRAALPSPLLPPAAALRLQTPRYLLHFAHHAQRIAAQNLEDVLVGEAALHQAAHPARR